ncbi:MAG: hypothetical protein H3C30_07260 [Candidatus Hydrogenedentes bacterium]|nr:hypothetical protein [Candidatus Hydrogenedentota bacterium]
MNQEYEKKRAEIEAALIAHVRDGAVTQFGVIPDSMIGGLFSCWDLKWGPAMTLGDVRCLRAVPILNRNGEVAGWRIRLLVTLPWWDTPNGVNAHRRFELDQWGFGIPGMPSVFFGHGGDRALSIQGFRREFADEDQRETIEEYARWRAHRLNNAAKFADLDRRLLEFEAEVMAEEDAHAKP